MRGMFGYFMTTDYGRAERKAIEARAKADLANAKADASGEIAKLRIATADWRSRATVLAANLNARKMSEDALLKALQAENANHPLAKRDAVDGLVDGVLDEEYKKRNADYEAYTANIEKLIP